MKDKLATAIKVVISVALIAWVFHRVNLAEVGQMLISAKIVYLLLALVLYLGAISLNAVKWQVLLRAQGVRVPLRVLLAYTFVGVFFNNFLPANVGGDVMRGYGLSRYTTRVADAAVSVIVDRIVGLIAYMGAAVLAAIAVVNVIGQGGELRLVEYMAFLSLAVIAGGFGMLLSRRLRALVGRLFQRQWLAPLAPTYTRISEAFGAYRFRYGAIALALLIALVGLMLTNLVNWLLAESVGGGIPLLYICLFNPLIALVLLVPISIGGIGVNQNVYPFFFGLLGIPKGLSLTVSLLMQAIIIVSSLPGGVLWWRLRAADAVTTSSVTPEQAS
ncbi:MAG: flippase-like domain-containing protein [Anaerolineae bacterium]|nr:flippase-like domain-containing protein [Anaerolineae bacterium]